MYDIEHVCKLTPQQEDQLAEAITRIHSETFETPRIMVNVTIKDISGLHVYVGGKPVCPSSNLLPGIHWRFLPRSIKLTLHPESC